MNQVETRKIKEMGTDFLFLVFCIYVFVLIGRPADLFGFLVPLRLALVFGLATLTLYFFWERSPEDGSVLLNPQVKLYIALVCIMIIGIPFSYYTRNSFMFFFNKYMNVIIFFYLFFRIVYSINRLKKVLLVICIGVGIYTNYSLLHGGFVGGRLHYGDMFDPNDLAYFLLSFILFNFLFISKENNKFIRIICLINLLSGLLLILMTGSRGGFLGLFCVMVLFFVSKTYTVKYSHKLIFLTICILLIALNSSKIDFERYKTLTNLKEDYNFYDETGRMAVWKTGMRLMFEHPLTGVGILCFREAIGRDRDEKGLLPFWQSAHNTLVQIGTETGVPGLIVFVLMCYKSVRIFGRVRKKAGNEQLKRIGEIARLGFVGHFVSAFFLSQAYSLYWVFYMVLSAVLYRLLGENVKAGSKGLNV